MPGLIRYTPQIQFSVNAAMLPYMTDGAHTQAQIDQLRLEAEARMITSFYTNSPDLFPILADSQDRHNYGDRQPRNGVYLDGSTRIMEMTMKEPEPEVPNGSD
jgi:hypothetical protein